MEYVSRKDAIEQGKNRYFTGKPCKHGHISERHCLNHQCIKCNQTSTARWQKENKVNAAAASKKWRDGNKDAAKQSYEKWLSENPEYHSDWKRKNKDKVCASASKYRKNHYEKVLATNRNRRAKLQKAEGRHTAQDVAEILASQDALCVYCGADIAEEYHVDHIMPLALGGSNWPRNLQCLCPPCNVSKQAIHPEEFLKRIGK
jgi:5-methylcytosine-specific restriction endonuclease McrA